MHARPVARRSICVPNRPCRSRPCADGRIVGSGLCARRRAPASERERQRAAVGHTGPIVPVRFTPDRPPSPRRGYAKPNTCCGNIPTRPIHRPASHPPLARFSPTPQIIGALLSHLLFQPSASHSVVRGPRHILWPDYIPCRAATRQLSCARMPQFRQRTLTQLPGLATAHLEKGASSCFWDHVVARCAASPSRCHR